MSTLHAATLIPDYADGDGEYSPWVVLHPDETQLDEHILDMHYANAVDAGEIGEDEMDDFVHYLETKGYTVPTIYTALHVVLVDGLREVTP